MRRNRRRSEEEERQIEPDQLPFSLLFRPAIRVPVRYSCFPWRPLPCRFRFFAFRCQRLLFLLCYSALVIDFLLRAVFRGRYSWRIETGGMVLSWYPSAHSSVHSDSSFFVSSLPLRSMPARPVFSFYRLFPLSRGLSWNGTSRRRIHTLDALFYFDSTFFHSSATPLPSLLFLFSERRLPPSAFHGTRGRR